MASSTAGGDPAPVIIKRKKKNQHGAHHGGGWKVAYADFVTAMMAFFLLLWLLNVTTSEQKQGIADYFAPASVSRTSSGSGGVLGGLTITVPGAMVSRNAPVALSAPTPSRAGEAEEIDEDAENLAPLAGGVAREAVDEQALEEALARREARQFEAAEQALRAAIESVPQLAELADSIVIEQVPEGLRIQLVDRANYSMFPLGSAEMYPQTRELLGLVAQIIGQLPNRIAISGHTDSTPFGRNARYDNWDLSTERANASRRALVAAGIDESRIERVVGRANRDHLFPENPADPRNRRISIVLLRETEPSGPTIRQ